MNSAPRFDIPLDERIPTGGVVFRGGWHTWAGLALAGLGLLACRMSDPVDRWKLSDGSDFGALARAQDTVATLLFDPAQCFECSSSLGRWLAWSNDGSRRVTLVLSRRPNATERALLVSRRIRPIRWLKDSTQVRSWPAALVWVRGRIADSAFGARQVQALAARWVNGQGFVAGGRQASRDQ